MSMLRFDQVDFAYDGTPALERIDLTVAPGSFTVVMGPSGCGKSTLVGLAAGLLTPTRGTVSSASQRPAVAFQDPALLPWKSARDNVAFALIPLGLSRPERRDRAFEALAAAGLAAAEMAKVPRQLSGGMRQRVALARALAIGPDLLLCDEPFSALDAPVRRQLRRDLRRIHDRDGLTTLFVTHDRDEARELADTVVVMAARRIDRIGRPAEVLATAPDPARDLPSVS